jgi:hypothetical protein
MKTTRVPLILLSCISLLMAQSRQDDAGEKLVGAWRLISVEGTDATFHFAYAHPTGIIIYDRSGWTCLERNLRRACRLPSSTPYPATEI